MSRILAYVCIGLGILSLLVWAMNMSGWVRLGDPTGQAIMVPVCVALGLMLLRRKAAK